MVINYLEAVYVLKIATGGANLYGDLVNNFGEVKRKW